MARQECRRVNFSFQVLALCINERVVVEAMSYISADDA
jgi:hypothetical protein